MACNEELCCCVVVCLAIYPGDAELLVQANPRSNVQASTESVNPDAEFERQIEEISYGAQARYSMLADCEKKGADSLTNVGAGRHSISCCA